MTEPEVPALRVLLARPTWDAHDEGAQALARALRDAGCEVIVSGAPQDATGIAHTAVQEDVDCVGLTVGSGSNLQVFADLLAALAQRGADDLVVFGGGPIGEADARRIEESGVARFFATGTRTDEVMAFLQAEAARRHAAPAEE